MLMAVSRGKCINVEPALVFSPTSHYCTGWQSNLQLDLLYAIFIFLQLMNILSLVRTPTTALKKLEVTQTFPNLSLGMRGKAEVFFRETLRILKHEPQKSQNWL